MSHGAHMAPTWERDRMEQTENVDVVVVGLGPGGEHAAIKLGRAGLDVVAIENRLVGGECPYWGCVPSKMMIAAAHVVAAVRAVPDFAGTAQVQPDWGQVARRVRDEATDDWDDSVAVKRLEEAGARLVRGRGRLDGPGRVVVDETTYVASRAVVLNTGTEPAVPPIEGLADTPYWTNRDAVEVTDLPASLVVLGGGAIGCEFAQTFARFGVRVTVVEALDRLLGPEEPEASALLEQRLSAEGVQVLTGVEVASVAHADGSFTLDLGDQPVTAERLLVATGRRPNLAGIGLETIGLDPDAKAIQTDERLRAAEKLYAVGDVTGKGAFTHVSMYQAGVVVRHLLGKDGPPADYRAVSRVTFTDPEVAAVGMTERQAREAGVAVMTASGDLGARGWIAKDEGLVKLVADRDRGVLVGGCVVGSTGGEVLSLVATAVHAEVPVESLRSMHFAYPTFHRAVLDELAERLA
jgi:pyruvate/2-oxoglutarate dehydrogenase complex dihydrolipoamide dehydrogenase (E3) component